MQRVEFDYSKLRGRIREKYGTEDSFSDVIGLSNPALSSKLNNKVGFRSEEIERCCNLLEIPDHEIKLYFFTLKTKKTS